ncbi:glycosyltransferase family 4 protein [Pseudoxanthomonas sp. PXM02]|uniref:glycosyltransferase family 4 protein n=1 Tax=Pseudoxanthomonas sp. PXM02 TaxID=2769294 RepID=UPI001782D35D|nr:glycosyltransferase family 4 protein [Pseudoxanthomonas sp. PXM02]MBD9478484.1 glycosyltransferase [Pseudoxanthomonas sp. PXM02]
MSVLWVDEQLPEPSRDSGSLRMFNLLRLLVAMGHRVDVLPLSRNTSTTGQQRLQDIGVRCADIGTQRPEAWFAREGTRYDAVIVSRYHLAWSWFPLLRRVHPRALKIVDTVDLHHVREQGEAGLRDHAGLRSAAEATRRHELRAIRDADVAWVVSEAERDLLHDIAPGARVEVISNVHLLPAATHRRPPGARLVFVGGAQHPPNLDGVRWLLADILPLILHRRPDCELHLVGRGLDAAAHGLTVPPSVVFHGQLDDVSALFETCRVGLAPLRFGAGVKGKVNHYMAFGVPTVATPSAVDGMHLQHGRDVLVAGDASGFADAVQRLLDDETLWALLSQHGRENVRRHFSIESAIPGIQATLALRRPDRAA